jgi:CBS-domain-containing membrane protein
MMVAGAAGGAVAIVLMELLSERAAFPLMFVPFATSIVLVMGSPEIEAAQPRALIGGHLLATLVGLAVVKITGPGPLAAALAVGLAMVAMHLTRCFHPPAGIDPLVIVVNDMSWSFLLAPVALGACLLAALGLPLAQCLAPRLVARALVVTRLPCGEPQRRRALLATENRGVGPGGRRCPASRAPVPRAGDEGTA